MSMTNLKAFAEYIDDCVCWVSGDPRGTFIELLESLLPVLLQALCPRKNDPPAPEDPTPEPSVERQAAWKKTWEVKCLATDSFDEATLDYSDRVMRRTSTLILRREKRNGKKLTKVEARGLALELLDAARKQPMEELVPVVAEALQAAQNLPPLMQADPDSDG